MDTGTEMIALREKMYACLTYTVSSCSLINAKRQIPSTLFSAVAYPEKTGEEGGHKVISQHLITKAFNVILIWSCGVFKKILQGGETRAPRPLWALRLCYWQIEPHPHFNIIPILTQSLTQPRHFKPKPNPFCVMMHIKDRREQLMTCWQRVSLIISSTAR